MNLYDASRRSARRFLWLVLPHTSRPFVGSIPRLATSETCQTLLIASRSYVPFLPSLDRIGSNPKEPARNASFQLRNQGQNFEAPQNTVSFHGRSFVAWSAAAASSRRVDTEASEEETVISGSGLITKIKPLVAVQAELKARTVKDEERGNGGGGQRSIRKVKGGVKGGGDERVERVEAGNAAGKSEGGMRKRNGTKGCKEEEEAVAVIAGVLREKFGFQIVREELGEWGSGTRSSENEEGVGKVKLEEEEEEEEEQETEEEANEEDAPFTTSPPTHPPPLFSRRVVSPSSLLSLYRFFSSHLGISSPSTVASLLTSKPQLLRSNPTNEFLPRVRLLQSYGVSQADIVHITESGPAWLRVPLAQIQNTLELLLAQGVHRSRLGFVLRRGRNLLCSEARSTNLDILVKKAGVPVDKLGVVLERYPAILTRSIEAVNTQLEMLSAYLQAKSGGKVEADSISTKPLKQRLNEPLLDTSHLSRVIMRFPSILSIPTYRIAGNIAILQSFTPPITPCIASSVLRRAPNILHFSEEALISKLQYFVELIGEEATGRVARSHLTVLRLSVENLQGKVAVLGDLIGRENAVRVVARFPLLLTSSEVNMKNSFKELVREVEEALEIIGKEESGTGAGDLLEEENEFGAEGDKRHRARRLVVDLVVKCPQSIYCSREANLKHKVEYLKRDMGLSIAEVLAFPNFLTYSLDRRIRPRHLALLQIGYVVMAHEAVRRRGVEDGRGVSIGAGGEGSKVCSYFSLSDEVEGVEGMERGAEETNSERTGDRQEQQGEGDDSGSGLLIEKLLEHDKPVVGTDTNQQLVNLEATRRTVCLHQFLKCTDKQFEEKFGVKL